VFVDEKTLCIFVSQSGETADTREAMMIAKSQKATCVALTNVTYSSLANLADIVIPVCAGPEIAVASTKAYVCQLTAIFMLACHIKNEMKNTQINYFEIIEKLANQILKFDKSQIDKLAKKLILKNDVIFIGKNLDNITATESALKLKEVTYINSTSYPSGELKHGFLALVENGTYVFAFAGDSVSKIKTINSASEASARGAIVVIVSNQQFEEADETIFVDEKDDLFAIRSIAPMQYLAYKVSILKGINPDQPRNLAKSVTVE
jgi:glucosamine--fructose-6-phosphate aminotransferase (isomerizing)